MTNKTVLSDQEWIQRGGEEQFFLYCSEDEFLQIARFVERVALQSPEIQQLRKDAERLDSGCIMTEEFDELGMDYMCERRGIDLRAAIDAAMEVKP